MGFETLLGNQRIKENLSASLEKGHVAQAYLLSGPEGSGKKTLARLLAAAIFCQGRNRPCMTCPDCRRVMAGIHPDCIWVDDPEKKTVPVDLIRQAREDIYIRPNQSRYKLYIFPRAQDMGLPGQNALLKILEEPPEYGVFLLLADNPHRLLTTVRSRCRELALEPVPEDTLRQAVHQAYPEADPQAIAGAVRRSGGYLGQAFALLEHYDLAPQTQALAQALCRKDPLALLQVLAPLEKSKRDVLAQLLGQWLEVLENALAAAGGAEPLYSEAGALARQVPPQRLYRWCQALRQGLECLQSNVSAGAVCGQLLWALQG